MSAANSNKCTTSAPAEAVMRMCSPLCKRMLVTLCSDRYNLCAVLTGKRKRERGQCTNMDTSKSILTVCVCEITKNEKKVTQKMVQTSNSIFQKLRILPGNSKRQKLQ